MDFDDTITTAVIDAVTAATNAATAAAAAVTAAASAATAAAAVATAATAVVTAVQQRPIQAVTWPLKSPDLNPIENVWHYIKCWLEVHYDIQSLNLLRLRRSVAEAWEAVPEDFLLRFEKCLRIMVGGRITRETVEYLFLLAFC